MSPLKTLGTFLLLFLFISPNICSAASLADFSVASLPGLEALPHANHAGFIPVDAFGKGNLFFWLVSSKVADANTAKRPLILWLQGGPICSSSFALFLEHGPYRVLNVNATEESAVLGLREINWIDTAGADVLYLDQPLGAGYSFTYGGVYVPYVADAVLRHNENIIPPQISINLKGIAIGNGKIDPTALYASLIPYADLFSVWPADSPFRKSATERLQDCLKDQRDNLKIWQGSCEDILDLIREGSKDYYGPCGANLYDLRVNDTSPNCSMGEDWPSGSLLLQQYMLFPSVLAALNVGNTTRIPKWELCSSIGEVLNNETTRPSSELLPGLLDAGIKVLQFAGAQDLVCNPLSQQWTAGNLSTFSSGLPAEHSFIVDGKTAGSVREGRNWTLVSIEFASHVAPADRPVEIAVMMKRWMEGKGVADGSEGLIVVTATRTATASSGSWRWNANGPFSTMIVSLVAYSLFVLFVPPA